MAIVYAWDDWNKLHITKHGSNAVDAKFVLEHAESPFPREIGGNKYLVWGKTDAGGFLEVVFTFKLPEALQFSDLATLDWATLIDYEIEVAVYIIHVMPMKAKQLREYRKLRRHS